MVRRETRQSERDSPILFGFETQCMGEAEAGGKEIKLEESHQGKYCLKMISNHYSVLCIQIGTRHLFD